MPPGGVRGGRLELIIGPMFSGKTEELLRRARRYQVAGQTVLLIKHSLDDRYTKKSIVTTHNGQEMPCITVGDLAGISSTYHFDVMLVDEVQFFNPAQVYNLYQWVVTRQKKTLICAGLDATFEMEPFLSVIQLIPRAESVMKLTAVCMECREVEASFSKRLSTENTAEVLVGGTEAYHAVCRACYTKI